MSLTKMLSCQYLNLSVSIWIWMSVFTSILDYIFNGNGNMLFSVSFHFIFLPFSLYFVLVDFIMSSLIPERISDIKNPGKPFYLKQRVEALRVHAGLRPVKLSVTLRELADFCMQCEREDLLIHKPRENPFKPKRSCGLI